MTHADVQAQIRTVVRYAIRRQLSADQIREAVENALVTPLNVEPEGTGRITKGVPHRGSQ